MTIRVVTLLLLLLLATGTPAGAQILPEVDVRDIDAVFQAFDSTTTPGCAVGVSWQGEVVLQRAYGMADLEHDVPNTPRTIFEPGSVSKQITSTATVLLALDGLISLDDDIRTYIPELPDYGNVITIRRLMNHTSGLRDWGSVADIEGWPRWTGRAHTNAHVLDIASRQRSLNYPPGEHYSYTNTAFNLQAILVERVTGLSLAEFSRERIFEPLGMTRTQWRDDYTRVVKDRAIGYESRRGGGWSMLMPFEDAYGNGGLLTTVEDLLTFTRNLETGELWGPRYVEEMHRQGVLNSGQVIGYASGIRIRDHRGVPEVWHSGSTAGYRGHLARFPEQGLAVAVVCNTTTGNAGDRLYEVADLYLADDLDDRRPPLPESLTLPPARLEALAGDYRDSRRGELEEISAAEGGIRLGHTLLVPVTETRFEASDGTVLELDAAPAPGRRPSATLFDSEVQGVRLDPVDSFDPTPAELGQYVGTYRSDEAEATYTVEMVEGALVMRDRWGQGRILRPLYPDAFSGGRGTTLQFHRDASGRVVEMSWGEERVWDLRFRKLR